MTPRATKHQKNTAKSQPNADRPHAPGYGIVVAKEGKGLLSWAWVARKMNNCRTFWLSTIHAANGRPHVMPLWGVWVDDAFSFSTGRKSRKGQNLAANSACTIANDDAAKAVIIEGQAVEEVQNGSAQHERTNLQSASHQGFRIHREELSKIGDEMDVIKSTIRNLKLNPNRRSQTKLPITNPPVFSAPTDTPPSTAAFPTRMPRTSG